MENKPKIIAKTSEEFKEIEDKLKNLSELIFSQIEIAEDQCLMGLTCNFKKNTNTTTFLPKETTQITNFGDYIGVYCGDFFFKIPKENKIDFIFIDNV